MKILVITILLSNMIKNKIFRQTFWFLFFIGILNLFATYLYLYWTSWWFDLLMHFLGGFWVSMVILSFWSLFNKNSHKILSFYKTFIWVLIISILWEIFEIWIGATMISDGVAFITDTISDLIMDIIGGILGYLYGSSILRSNKNV